MEAIKTISNEAKDKMEKTVASLKAELSRLRTGRASQSLLDGIRVEYYGSLTPLNQVANISIPEPKLIVIQPWDTSAMQAIEKAIIKSDLGFNPQIDGKVLRIPIPSLTEERRKEIVKLVKKFGEDSKVSVRNQRRLSNEAIKAKEKSKEISEDDTRRAQEQIQKMTDDFIVQIDKLLETKEKEVLQG